MKLNEQAELFSVSVSLTYSCIGLEKIMAGKNLNTNEENNFKRIGSLLCQMDHDSPYQSRSTASVVLATTIRPYFYNSLLKQRENWNNRQFLDNLYLTLESGGKQQLLSEDELGSANDLFRRMSDRILSDLRQGQGQI